MFSIKSFFVINSFKYENKFLGICVSSQNVHNNKMQNKSLLNRLHLTWKKQDKMKFNVTKIVHLPCLTKYGSFCLIPRRLLLIAVVHSPSSLIFYPLPLLEIAEVWFCCAEIRLHDKASQNLNFYRNGRHCHFLSFSCGLGFINVIILSDHPFFGKTF